MVATTPTRADDATCRSIDVLVDAGRAGKAGPLVAPAGGPGASSALFAWWAPRYFLLQATRLVVQMLLASENACLHCAGRVGAMADAPFMRIDLYTGGQRPLPLRVGLAIVRRFLGMDPGPPTALSFRPDLLGAALRAYIVRSAHGQGGWSKGETELFNAFVSRLNSCNF